MHAGVSSDIRTSGWNDQSMIRTDDTFSVASVSSLPSFGGFVLLRSHALGVSENILYMVRESA